MTNLQRIMLYIVLPVLAPLLIPPAFLASSGLLYIIVGIELLNIFAIALLLRGRSTGLTLSIFLQGLNVIIRLMTLFPNVYVQGQFNPLFLISSVLSMGLSMYLVLRLDKVDVRATMTA